MHDAIFLWVMLVIVNYAFMVLVALRRRPQAQTQPTGGLPAGRLLLRLPSGFGIGHAWRRYVQAVLDLRQSQPDEARQAVEAVWSTGGAAPPLLADRAAQRVRTAGWRLDRALRSAGRSDLQLVVRGRAWRAAVRLWSARGYRW